MRCRSPAKFQVLDDPGDIAQRLLLKSESSAAAIASMISLCASNIAEGERTAPVGNSLSISRLSMRAVRPQLPSSRLPSLWSAELNS